MINQVKMATRVTTNAYDQELLMLIASGIQDLKSNTGCQFSADATISTSGVVTDYNVTDPMVQVALCTYVRLHFGQPSDFDKLNASY